jgi:HEAT repeat protein
MSHSLPTLVLALILAPTAAAQLDLPDKNGKDTTPPGLVNGKSGDLAPHLTCSVCYTANYTTPVDWNAKKGLQKTFCSVCQTARLHYVPRQGKGKGSGVDLPGSGKRGTGPRGTETNRPVDQAEAGPPRSGANTVEEQLSRAAEEILLVLERIDSVDDAIAIQAGETLLSLGGPGRVAARLALGSDHAPKMLTGVRVLLRTGVAEDGEVVVARLRRRMPIRAAAASIAELVALDPVRATPRLMCELLDHPQQPVRAAAQRQLVDRTAEEVLPHLVSQLESKRGDTRLRAVDILARLNDPATEDLLLSVLDDPRAKVARRATLALARIDDEALDLQLLSIAFGERWVLRRGAYALLAIIEREDARLRPVLHGQHVEALLRGLDSRDVFVSGTCAAALAGIGFRAESAAASPWLNDIVPAKLVNVVSGFEFFEDYEALREPALARLKQVTGVSLGTDGPAWAGWWIESRETFAASRAIIPVEEGDERSLSLAVADRTTGEAFVLVGPDLAGAAPVDKGEVFYLGAPEAKELLGFLRGQGLFGLERLPGARGAMVDRGRVLDLRVGTGGKTFVFGSGAGEAWFDLVVGHAQAIAERNQWQRFPNPKVHGDRLGVFNAEGAWWSGDHDPRARAARLKGMIFERALNLGYDQRDAELEALAVLYQDPANVDQSDFAPLVKMLGEERWFAGRAKGTAQLARRAAGLVAAVPAQFELDEAVQARLWTLVDTLHGTFSADAMPELAELVANAGHPFARAAAADQRPILRAVAAYTLAAEPNEADLGVLATLLADPVIDVEVAAVDAIGRGAVESLRTEVLLRARLGKADVRIAALDAVGRLRGPNVRDILTTALTGDDDRFRLAATRGLANLQDPATASLMVSLLRTRGVKGMAEILRGALYDLGEEAWDELFLAMRSPSPELRRSASLLLARQRVPASAPVLMEVLAGNPADNEVARELTILTCVDERREIDPAESWFRWLDGVKRSDALAWFRAAAEARGVPAPAAEAFVPGNRDTIGFLVEVMRLPEDWLAERARRELEALIGRPIDTLPPQGTSRDAWLLALLEALDRGQ